MTASSADVVVVGGGSCGAVLAARLSEDPDRTVLLIEAGAPEPPLGMSPAHILPIGPGAPRARTYATTLREGVHGTLVRGVGLGGSGAVNGGYFIRATPADLDGWARAAAGSGADWSYEAALPYFRRSEADRDFGAGSVHGDAGPIPVSRRTADAWCPVTTRFMAAAGAAGFPEEPDKNAGGAPGAGPVPCNIRDGLRVDPGSAYLGASLGRPNLTVRTGASADRILLRAGTVRGVVVREGGAEDTVGAPLVVLAAGAIETPALLWRSGIGDPRMLGAGAAHPLPAVGREFSDHPELVVPYAPADGLAGDHPPAPLLEACLHLDDGRGGAVEIRPYTASFGAAVPGNPPMPPALGVSLMAPDGRGRMTPRHDDPHGAPVIEHHYLTDPRDRAAARTSVDLARGLLDAAGIGAPIDGMPPQLGSSQHLAGTCPMGMDPLTSVVDGHLRVHGLGGLAIADVSVFPQVPSRGPHATAVMLAERAAEFLAAGG